MQMRFQGKEAIGIAVSMRKGGDVIRLGKQMTETVTKLQREFPVGIAIDAVSDQPKVVQDSIGEFVHSLGEAVIIVLAVSFIALGMRVGFVVALSIPLVLAMTFLAMYMLDIDLQRVSLGALIIALGLLVDDAIIAVEMMALKLEQGWDRLRAATYAYTSTAFPMLTGTLITAASFLPIGMAKTNAGEYTFSIFQVVGISLILSWIVAVIFTPYIAFKLLPDNMAQHGHDEDAVYQRPVYACFRRLVDWCVVHRRAVVATTVGLFVLSIALFKFVPQQFFPESDRPELMVDLWLPQGASYAATEREVKAMEQALAGNEDIVSVTSYVGVGSPRFYLPLDQQTPNINFGQLVVMTHGEESRERVLALVQDLFEHDFPLVRGRVTRLENGPPVGYPVQFRVSGPDDRQVAGIADQVATLMRAHPNVRRVNSDAGEQVKVMRAEIDQDKVRMLGLSTREVARMMQIGLSGLVTTQFREGDEAIEIVARLEQAERTDLGNLKDAKLYLTDGHSVALSQVARLSLDAEDSILWRRNRVPTITVRADVAGAQGNDVTTALQLIAELSKALPLGYSIVVAGSSEASATSSAAIMAVVPVALVVILVLLVATLFTSLYPRVMVSSPDFGNSLTVSDAASSHYALAVMTVVALIFTPLVLLYQGWTYYVFRARVVNPRWIAAMRRHGYKGAFELAATVDYLFGFDATAGVVHDWMYEKLANEYVLDEATQDFLRRSNPWALHSVVERLNEAAERGLWSEPDPDTLAAMNQVYLDVEGELEDRAE